MPRLKHVAGPRAIIARIAAPTLIAIGYVDLARGGTVVAPLALVIGYLALVPAALLAD
jgi:hypothetical protein